MADKGKKGKGGGGGPKKGGGGDKAKSQKVEKVDKAEKAEKAEETEKVEKAVEAKPAAREAHDDHGHDDHAHGGHGAAAAHGGHKVNRREYWVIFVALFVLTILEVGVAQVPGIPYGLMVIALVLLALSKAACVALFYMHLKHETKFLKMTVFLPFTAPAVYALVLIAEGAWRNVRW